MQIEDCKLKTGGLAGGRDFPAASLVFWSSLALWTLLVFAAIVLCWRRLAGALENPLESTALVGAGVAAAAAAAAIRLEWRGQGRGWTPRRPARLHSDSAGPLAREGLGVGGDGWATLFSRCLPWTVSAAVVALGAALSLPRTPLPGLAILWAVLLGEELWGWAWLSYARVRTGAAEAAGGEPAPRAGSPTQSEVHAMVAEGPDLEEIPADDILQQLIRRRATDGSEVLSGWLRVPLAAGQRTANIHVAFCPPFPRTPQVAVEQLDGPGARIKKVQVLPYGVRLDLKLAELSEAATAIVLQFSALSGPPAQSVAQLADPEVEPMD